MHGAAPLLVLLSALFHATWNAQLKGHTDRVQFMAKMSTCMGGVAALFIPFVSLPTGSAWACVALSAVLHLLYNLLLLENYRMADFSSAYPIARGVSPLLVSLGAYGLMHQQLTRFGLCGVGMISGGIVFLSTGKARAGRSATISALGTGVVIAAYTVTDGMGIQRSRDTLSYTAWIFASYLFMPLLFLALRKPTGLANQQHFPAAIGAGLCSLAAYTLVLWATHTVDVGMVSALRETSVLWAIVLGIVFLGEPFTWRRAASALVICLGIFSLVVNLR